MRNIIDRCRFASAFVRATQCAAIGIALLFSFPAALSSADAPLTIRVSTQHTPAMATFQSLDLFKKRIEEASEGRIRIEIHHSAELYSDVDAGPAVSSGAIEMGFVEMSRYAETIPAADLFQLPFMFNTGNLEKRALAPGSEIRELIEDAILARAGARVLWWASLGQTVFESNGISVANPEMIGGKTVRVIGPTTSAIVTDCGGLPKDIPGPKLEKAFEAHEAGMAMTAIGTVLGRNLWRYFDTITRTNHASVQFAAVINEAFWQRLSLEQRALIEEAALDADDEARRAISEVEAKTYKELAEGKGMKIIELTQDELRLWRICSSDVLQQFLDRSGPLGEDLLRAYGRMRAGSHTGVSR